MTYSNFRRHTLQTVMQVRLCRIIYPPMEGVFCEKLPSSKFLDQRFMSIIIPNLYSCRQIQIFLVFALYHKIVMDFQVSE